MANILSRTALVGDVPASFIIYVVNPTGPAEWQATQAQLIGANLSQIAGLADPGADRILGWDDSAGSMAYFTLGSGLSITGTTIDVTAPGGGGMFLTPTAVQTTDYTAALNENVRVDVSGAAVLITIDSTGAVAGESKVQVTLVTGSSANACTITSTNDIDGQSFNSDFMTLLTEGDTVIFTWYGGSVGWGSERKLKQARGLIQQNASQNYSLTGVASGAQVSSLADPGTDYIQAISFNSSTLTPRRKGFYRITGRISLTVTDAFKDIVLLLGTPNGDYFHFTASTLDPDVLYCHFSMAQILDVGDAVGMQIFGPNDQTGSATKSSIYDAPNGEITFLQIEELPYSG